MTALQHFGVKGMRWGQRRAAKKEFKRAEKQREYDFYDNKIKKIVGTAANDPTVLVKVGSPGAVPTVVTGKQFIDYMSRGGYMDKYTTEIFAKRTDSGYEIQAPQGRYKKQKFVYNKKG